MWKRILLAASALAVAVLPAAVRSDQRPVTQVRWRNIGPALPEGRASSVVGSEHDPLLYYAGTADGGVWKSGDGGVSWHNLTDSIHLASVGALALDPSDDNTLWVGAGETNPRNDIIQERGLYRTTNGGRTWQTVTFPGGPGTSKIVLDPKDPKHVVIGVLGDVFAPSVDRGVYVTFDGGATWSKSLFVSQQSGASDLAMDPHDPNVIFAGMWHVLRRPWAMTSGGTDDGLYRSADGGKTWTQVIGQWFSAAADRTHRPCDRADRFETDLRAGRNGKRCALALGRRRRELEDDEQGFAREPASLLLLPRARRAGRREYGIRRQHAADGIVQWRREV